VRLEGAHSEVFTSCRLVVCHGFGGVGCIATLLHGSLTIGGKRIVRVPEARTSPRLLTPKPMRLEAKPFCLAAC